MRMKPWPKRIASWVEAWNAAIRWRPNHKIKYGARPKPRYYIADGGPYNGQLLALVDGNTATIRVGNKRGRYRCGIVATAGAHAHNYGITKWIRS